MKTFKEYRESLVESGAKKVVNGKVYWDVRKAGQEGIYVDQKSNKAKVGQDIDYFDSNGDKQYGKVTKYDGKKISIKDAKTKTVITQDIEYED